MSQIYSEPIIVDVGMDNPMSAAGDLIVGGTSGAPARLAKGSNGQVLKIVSGSVVWGANTAETPCFRSTVTLSPTGWSGSDPYYQTVTIPNVTTNSIVDLYPTLSQMNTLQEDGVLAIQAENNNGAIRVAASGGYNSAAMTIQYIRFESGINS